MAVASVEIVAVPEGAATQAGSRALAGRARGVEIVAGPVTNAEADAPATTGREAGSVPAATADGRAVTVRAAASVRAARVVGPAVTANVSSVTATVVAS